MVFVFPADIEQQALRQQRTEDVWATIQSIGKVAIKVLKMVTAFGLIVSTIIVAIAGMVAMVAAMVALSRGGGDTRGAQRQLRNLFLTVRQLLWCYAMFGPMGEGDGQDPFLREAAYDTSLVLSLCCGNPSSFWFWIRASHLRRRRRRYGRGWAHRVTAGSITDYDDTASDLEGVSLVRRNQWGDTETLPVPSSSSEEHRGLLSVAVEFLFGSTIPSGPSEADKWRLRNAVIVQKSTTTIRTPNNSTNQPISLEELMPYSDCPPKSFEDKSNIVSEGLLIVSHFNGRPATLDGDTSSKKNESSSQALFHFPELISEGSMSTRYNDNLRNWSLQEDNNQSVLFDGIFYLKDNSNSNNNQSPRSGSSRLVGVELPSYLCEERQVFSRLASKQFFHCLLIAVLNFLGVVWFAQSLNPGGILDASLGNFGAALKWSLIPILQFYSKLFFTIPVLRLIYILGWNQLCKRRNQRRKHLATLLEVDNGTSNQEEDTALL